jgi:hypothetical protein
MTTEPTLPSAADLDAHESQQGKSGHDAVMDNLTKPPQVFTLAATTEETAEAVDYVKSKGYSDEAAAEIVAREGAVVILKSKAHEASLNQLPPPPPTNQALERDPAILAARAPVAPTVVNRYGVVFEPETHAAHPSGEPKFDSTGKFILKEHDYAPRTPNVPGGK